MMNFIPPFSSFSLPSGFQGLPSQANCPGGVSAKRTPFAIQDLLSLGKKEGDDKTDNGVSDRVNIPISAYFSPFLSPAFGRDRESKDTENVPNFFQAWRSPGNLSSAVSPESMFGTRATADNLVFSRNFSKNEMIMSLITVKNYMKDKLNSS
ncbi:hypothetical protein LOTGIDRAFT_161319 [Lottia gigantea]|uniref:Uncharacterized protein n=1 Tax=Lottia gigantea TaxID=225164 RepID=V4BYB9_LOTGI|nr:hypothetical protein LOTGIDRAFT_161319 [Lottia gigantea]ESO94124.1 hypothetical protein LOTGIDRAFT_161319 [Lottia gigantea]